MTLAAISSLACMSRREVWVDAKTHLMWAAQDNGFPVTWNQGLQYCESSSIGGFGGWTLPTVDQLARLEQIRDYLFDPLADKIRLSDEWLWSATRASATGGSEGAWDVRLTPKRPPFHLVNRVDLYAGRALCVRPAGVWPMILTRAEAGLARQRSTESDRFRLLSFLAGIGALVGAIRLLGLVFSGRGKDAAGILATRLTKAVICLLTGISALLTHALIGPQWPPPIEIFYATLAAGLVLAAVVFLIASRFPQRDINQWRAERREQRIEALNAAAAEMTEGEPYELHFLHQRGFVRATGTGGSIETVNATFENLTLKNIHVVIAPGTFFISSAFHQNMVTTTQYSFVLHPSGTHRLRVSAACINANRPVPRERDYFSGVARVPKSIARFLEASKGESSMVIQAGVWTLTDNLSRHQLINYQVSGHAITHAHCDRAKEILNQLGIAHRLWYSDKPYEKTHRFYKNGWYSGELRHGEYHGRGTYTWHDGESYEGEWKNGKRHGEGVFIFFDGSKYIGKFDQGREVGGWIHHPNNRQRWSVRNPNGQWEHPDPPGNSRSTQTNHESRSPSGL